jgi:hypothetical protein
MSDNAQAWQAVVLGTRDFVRKNGGTAAVLGLSGGIDAAVTAAVAADALGPENVLGVAMPAPTSPPAELEDARPPTFAQGVGAVLTGAGLALAVLAFGGRPRFRAAASPSSIAAYWRFAAASTC